MEWTLTSPAVRGRIANYKLPLHCVLLLALCPAAFAQGHNRLVAPLDSHKLVTLRGGRSPRIEMLTDEGAVAPTERVRGLGFRFKPTAEQSAALEQLLQEQQNPSSPLYHAWLTPEEYADQFGLSRDDLARVSDWLESQGFHIDSVSRSRTWITFSATAGQVRHTFKTELHRFHVNGRARFANVAEAQIPADLEPLVYTLRGLDDLPRDLPERVTPLVNLPDGTHGLVPGDLATIYNVNPLLQKGFNGAGQKIVVAGKSALKMADIQAFRNQFGLPKNDPKVILVPGFADPGMNEEFTEVTADVELAGASAPNASIIFVYAPNAYAAAEYAVDQNLAPIISFSFGGCEKKAVPQPAVLAATRAMAQQANAQGITWVACSGDTGAAGCESQREDDAGLSGISVNLPAGFPEVTGVGGTMFADGTGAYWEPGYTKAKPTALSYIPETAWNETATGKTLATSSGGASMFYSRPAWQTGPGVPSVNARLVPDISFAAAWDHDPYLIVADGEVWSWGGTSAATPFFAGVLSILNQYLVSTGVQARPGLGNINPRLYQLAQTTSGVFHDITTGNNIIPCKTGTPDCTTGRYGYNAGPGWDPVTGLGSLDVSNFVLNWAGASSTPGVTSTTVTLTASPSTVLANASTVLTAAVKPASGTTLPTGPVYFSVGQTALGYANLSNSGGIATAGMTVKGSQLASGVNTITAFYGGASTFLSSTGSANVTVTASAAASAVVPSVQPSPVYPQAPDADGFAWYYTLRLAETAGMSTTITAFSIDDTDYTGQFPALFGSSTLAANGTLSAAMRAKLVTVPSNHVFAFSGVDPGGQRWNRQLTVSFMAEQGSAAMSLSSSPATVRQNPKGDPNCPEDRPLYQQLNLQELNGYEVRLTKFLAGSNDFSDQIESWFGSLRLAPLGTLRANICWQLDTLPATRSYEVDGVDTGGHTVKTTLQVTFKTAPLIPGTLAISKNSVEFSTASGPAKADLNVTLPGDEAWTVSTLPANQKSLWLAVSPKSGRGPAQVNLVASATGLANGIYTATLVFQSENTVPQFINVPVVFLVGVSGGTTITGAQNAASFKPVFAPGMLMSLYGTKLANTTQSAKSLPLPLTLDGVSATVNGLAAPLWFVSPGQINLQIPYETALGGALVVVNNNGQVSSYAIQVTATAPGIFNNSGAITPVAAANRGSSVSLYLTGDGELTPMLDTGAPPPANTPVAQLPKPRATVKVTVGGVPADVTFIGNPWLVGITQVNFNVPANTPTGAQPVVVTAGGVSSVAQTLTVR
jgi:uncharacterized protein (TIGR03437 family)